MSTSMETLLVYLVVGLVAGFLASKVVRGGGLGMIGDIIVGLVGGAIGGWLFARFGGHLDVLGHYHDETPEKRLELRHHDWLTSGSLFDDAHFEALMDAIAQGMLSTTT